MMHFQVFLKLAQGGRGKAKTALAKPPVFFPNCLASLLQAKLTFVAELMLIISDRLKDEGQNIYQ